MKRVFAILSVVFLVGYATPTRACTPDCQGKQCGPDGCGVPAVNAHRLHNAWKSVVSADAIEEACKSGRFKYMTRQKNRVLHVKASFRLAGPYISRAQAGLLQPVARAAMAPALWRVLLVPGKK